MPLIHTVNTLLPSPALFWGFFYFPRWKSRPHVPRASYYLIKKGKKKKSGKKKEEKIKKKKTKKPPPSSLSCIVVHGEAGGRPWPRWECLRSVEK